MIVHVYICICPSSLDSLGLKCNTTNTFQIITSERQWVGIAYNKTMDIIGMIAHQHCPFDYCKRDIESLSIHLEYEYQQCAFNRSGILCGGCQIHFSNVLGTSKSKKCSSLMLLAVIPSGLLSGLLLVIILMVLNLTVSLGTINGIIFYANIIQAQYSTQTFQIHSLVSLLLGSTGPRI